ncbi:hypothetical protein [Prevotella heparinolytica]|uniref:hypothetical protein n=1 Tax=Prevotella heparinolytica TaxID=28113 RepID=UPI00163A9490|nr:hypothetical protein [Bacteroides heparinolyticus]
MKTLVKERTLEVQKPEKSQLTNSEKVRSEQRSFVVGISKNRKITMCASHSCNAK